MAQIAGVDPDDRAGGMSARSAKAVNDERPLWGNNPSSCDFKSMALIESESVSPPPPPSVGSPCARLTGEAIGNRL
jgi:hypothetical protein